jgi:hypothetical protein
MYCLCLAVARRYGHDLDAKVRRCMEVSMSFGCETHRVNELIVRLRIVQL